GRECAVQRQAEAVDLPAGHLYRVRFREKGVPAPHGAGTRPMPVSGDERTLISASWSPVRDRSWATEGDKRSLEIATQSRAQPRALSSGTIVNDFCERVVRLFSERSDPARVRAPAARAPWPRLPDRKPRRSESREALARSRDRVARARAARRPRRTP